VSSKTPENERKKQTEEGKRERSGGGTLLTDLNRMDREKKEEKHHMAC